jgi:ComF family protein
MLCTLPLSFIMSALKNLLHLIFPAVCASCQSQLSRGEEEVCLSCLTDIEETDFHSFAFENELYFRFAGKVPLSGAASLFWFDKSGKLQKVISQMKYHHRRSIGDFLGRYYVSRLRSSETFTRCDAIVPVPLHPTRLAQRGYNQAEYFARGLSKGMNIPVNVRALQRTKATTTQTRKNASERWENVKEGFQWTQPAGKHILLVDDVITTGATLEACIRAIMESEFKPESICIASIASTRKN